MKHWLSNVSSEAFRERANAFRAKEAGEVEAIPIEGALPQEFVKAEKNLETLGFFTPSSNWTRDVKKKVISFTITIDGKKVKASATIFPSAEFGLPDTADLDKYRAFQKILSDELIKNGKVPKHITFTSADLIEAMGISRKNKSGKSYTGRFHKEIRDWMMRMISTTISSEGAVWLAGKKTWVTDTVHVFERVVAYGQELEADTIADRHHVWLSDWQKEAIANFPEKDEWVEGRVQYNIEVRNLMAKSKMIQPLTEEEIEERRITFSEQYPVTDEDRRKWLAGNEEGYRLEDIMNELKQRHAPGDSTTEEVETENR